MSCSVVTGWFCCECGKFTNHRWSRCRDCGHLRCDLKACTDKEQVAVNLQGSREVLQAIEETR